MTVTRLGLVSTSTGLASATPAGTGDADTADPVASPSVDGPLQRTASGGQPGDRLGQLLVYANSVGNHASPFNLLGCSGATSRFRGGIQCQT